MSNEREQRYAEAISEASGIAAHRPQVRKEASAVMAVADAEIEQAEGRVAEWQREAESAEAEVARLTTLLEQRTAALTRTIDAKNTAEAQIARLRELATEWAKEHEPKHPSDWGYGFDEGGRMAGEWILEVLDGGQP